MEARRLGGLEAWWLGGFEALGPGGLEALVFPFGGCADPRLAGSGPLWISWVLMGCSWLLLGSSLGALGLPLGALEGALELLGAPWMLLGNSVVFLESAWLLLGSSWSFLGRSLGWTWGGLSRLASISSALLGVLGVEMLQNVAVAKEWAVFLQKCCCGLRSGGVPLQFLGHRPPRSQFAYKTNGF